MVLVSVKCVAQVIGFEFAWQMDVSRHLSDQQKQCKKRIRSHSRSAVASPSCLNRRGKVRWPHMRVEKNTEEEKAGGRICISRGKISARTQSRARCSAPAAEGCPYHLQHTTWQMQAIDLFCHLPTLVSHSPWARRLTFEKKCCMLAHRQTHTSCPGASKSWSAHLVPSISP